jgi:hypothetical protein
MEYTLFQITTGDSIGNTLSAINQNYDMLDDFAYNLQLSAINYWIPMAEIYESRKDSWKKATEQIKDNFELWVNTSTTFEQNSSRWITPIVVWYPCFFNYKDAIDNPNFLQTKILEWLNLNYPVFSISAKPNYTENQNIVVYSFNNYADTSVVQTYNFFDSTQCRTSDARACAYCSKCYHGGGVNCNNGHFTCGGCTNCSTCENVTCTFDKNQKTKNSTIAANLKVEYANKYEASEINAYVYTIKKCEWVFQKVLSNLYII